MESGTSARFHAIERTVLEPVRALITLNFARRGPVFSNIPHAARQEHEDLVQALIREIRDVALKTDRP